VLQRSYISPVLASEKAMPVATVATSALTTLQDAPYAALAIAIIVMTVCITPAYL